MKVTTLSRRIAATVSVFLMIFLVGCSTSPKTQVVQMGDEGLSREQLLNEIAKLDAAQKQVDSNKGVTGTNVLSALFWVPGLAYTYYDASKATETIENRRSHLTNLYNKKYGSSEQVARTASSKKPS